jgi:hypothetical protein
MISLFSMQSTEVFRFNEIQPTLSLIFSRDHDFARERPAQNSPSALPAPTRQL